MPAESEIAKMSEAELRNHLLTQDYKGVKFKTLVLDELVKRAYNSANTEQPEIPYNKCARQWSTASCS